MNCTEKQEMKENKTTPNYKTDVTKLLECITCSNGYHVFKAQCPIIL
jgi:hypothetical protein